MTQIFNTNGKALVLDLSVVFCKNCGYSKFYNKNSSTASNVIDLFFGG
ncbi:hypothetical protein CU633_04215 [Bacillus sp. V3-13]|nr:hypothetical protein CU633_04215 [Bacillus sp. V3-13]